MKYRRVGLRQFQQNFHKEIKELPFIVTKYGKDLFVVTKLTTDVVTLNVARVTKVLDKKVKDKVVEMYLGKSKSILFE